MKIRIPIVTPPIHCANWTSGADAISCPSPYDIMSMSPMKIIPASSMMRSRRAIMIMVVGLDLIIFNGIDDPSHYKDSLLSSFFEVASFSSGLSLCSIISMMQRRTEKPNTIIVMKRLTPSDSQKSYPEEGYKTDQIVRSPRPGLFKYHGCEYNPMRARRYEVYSTSFSTPFLFRGESFQRFDFSLKINIYCFPRFSWMMYPSFARRKRSVRAV